MGESLGAGLVGRHGSGAWCAGEAGVCCSRVSSASFENVWVGTSHDVRHHCAGGGAHNKHFGSVATVFVEGVVNHADYPESVASLSVGQATGTLDVPAVVHVGCTGIDENETVLVCV